MNVKELRESGKIIMECVAGSKLYGLNTPESDTDIRGIFIQDENNLIELPQEVSDEKSDIKFYSLKKFMKLAADCNPNIIELLFIPKDKLIQTSPQYDLLCENAHLFMSKKARHTFTGYAYSQIQRAKGKNKKVHDVDKYMTEEALQYVINLYHHNEWEDVEVTRFFNKFLLKYIKTQKPKDNVKICDYSILKKPVLTDFCYVVPTIGFNNYNSTPGMRPYKVAPSILQYLDMSKVNHIDNLYKTYINGEGIISNNQIRLKSISKERELEDFNGIISIQQDAYTKAVKGYKSFWEWFANRNIERWKTQANGNMDYDAKNMLHTLRLLYSSENIALNAVPIIDFSSHKQFDFLMNIRLGKYSYEELLEIAEKSMNTMADKFQTSTLPNSSNMKKINELYKKIIK